MLLGQVFQSIVAWQKLSAIPLKPKIAYAILKYTRKVTDEHALAEKQRVALIHEITGTKDGEEAKIEPNTPEFSEYVTRFNEIMATESDLEQIDMDLEDVVNALDDKDEALSVSDLAMLEPFFHSYWKVEGPPEDENEAANHRYHEALKEAAGGTS